MSASPADTDSKLWRLANSLVRQRHALWLGAGVSFASGVPTVLPLQAHILTALGAETDLLEEYAAANVPFETFMEVLMSVADTGRLFDVFKGELPSIGHITAAKLAKQGLVRSILTTNFDTLIEDALASESVSFDLISDDDAFRAIDWTTPIVRVIKIHGTISDIDALGVTIRKVASRQHAETRGQVVRGLVETEDKGGIVILGYSCSDHFDLSPAARHGARSDRRVLYVEHQPIGASTTFGALRESRPNNPFAGYDSWHAACSTDRLLSAVLAQLGEPQPSQSTEVAGGWRAIVDDWLSTITNSANPGSSRFIVGMIVKSANLWQKSSLLLREAIASGLSPNQEARAWLALGNNMRDLGLSAEGTAALERARAMALSHGLGAVEARALNTLGILAADAGEHDQAIALYKSALALSQLDSDRELEGKCSGNLGLAYKNRAFGDDLALALAHQETAREIAVAIGDKRSEGRTLGNIGLIYRALGNVNRSCEHYDAAREIACSLGDKLHIGIWTHNKGEDLVAADPSVARILLKESRDIFRALGQNNYAQESERVLAEINVSNESG